MEYRIVSASHHDELETQINRLLKEGWQLHGGLIVIPYAEGHGVTVQRPDGFISGQICQAMIRTHSAPND